MNYTPSPEVLREMRRREAAGADEYAYRLAQYERKTRRQREALLTHPSRRDTVAT